MHNTPHILSTLSTASPASRAPRTGRRRPAGATVLAAATALGVTAALTACGSDDTEAAAISVDNCGSTVNLDAAPDNVTLLKPASVPTLAALGVLDDVTAKAGQYPTEYYDQDTNDALAAIPSLTDQLDASGHLQISAEKVLENSPDLVIGATDTVSNATMSATGTPVVEEPALCGTLGHPAGWDDVADEVRLYGTLFDQDDRADQVVTDLQAQVDELTAAVDPDESRSVAVLYPTAGGGPTYAYGTGSMSNEIVTDAGLTNVFGDQTDRVFEVTAEELADRNPDIIISLYSTGDADAAVNEVRDLAAAKNTTAVTSGHIMPLLMNYMDPPTPLAVDGLSTLTDYLAANPAGSTAAGTTGKES